MRTSEFLLLISALICAVSCEVFYEEKFSDGKSEIIDLYRQNGVCVPLYIGVENILAGFFNTTSLLLQIPGKTNGLTASIPERNSENLNGRLANSSMTKKKTKVCVM